MAIEKEQQLNIAASLHANQHNIPTMTRRSSSVAVIHHDKGSVWYQVLSSVRARNTDKPDAHIILLGNNGVGRSALLRGLQEVGSPENVQNNIDYYENTQGVSAIDYAYVNVRELQTEDDLNTSEIVGRCNVWMIQNEKYKDMLIDVLREEKVNGFLLGVICLDLSKSYSLLSELNKWLSCMTQIFTAVINTLSVEQQDVLRNKLSAYIATYRQNVLNSLNQELQNMQIGNSNLNFASSNSTGFHTFNTLNNNNNSNDNNLDEGEDKVNESSSLLFNLGIPFVVVVCKSDTYTALDTRTTQGWIEVIQAYLRKVCLPYGASIVFTNCKDTQQPRNVFLLYRYLMHLLYGFTFREPGDMTSKDALFIPSGYDSEEQIKSFASKTILPNLDKPYETIITKPVTVATYGADVNTNVTEEPMDEFLSKLLMQFPASELRGNFTPPVLYENVSTTTTNSSNAKNQTTLLSSGIKTEKTVKLPPRRTTSGEKAPITLNADANESSGGSKGGIRASSVMLPPKRGESKDAVSLQSFFQNLLAKNRGKGAVTPRERTRRERPDRTNAELPISPTTEDKEKEKDKSAMNFGGEKTSSEKFGVGTTLLMSSNEANGKLKAPSSSEIASNNDHTPQADST